MKKYLIYTLLLSIFVACSEKGQLSQSTAKDLIESHLANEKVFESATITLGEMKLKTNKDTEKIKQIKLLGNENFFDIEEIKSKKRLFSSDSLWIINIKLDEKALPYVIELKETKAKVKTIEYQLTTSKDITIEQKGEKRANASAILRKVKTPFYSFGKDKTEQDFIVKTFKFKYSDENGWEIIR
ncbi:hypothetical protein [Capnocytophaga catalasegens]|uniref:Lipoprotein n=1 Tax=Capnocytophaga catalasegens TaxID=1004260 RepID=A0AAV5B0C3_9FLAO|nr:hypothetical protein [Capnocytophaga catalasegens]GIZ15460.1 hypothetical protein RCZ03_14600 [Capnocytophaga catalasegens]GJM51048.1 hypothetical protein RCZ15_20210 [Capnocytophaga catalasegens]GJM52233.1 hypothetical protein RCZ16_05510 [Capnocytophaga catalasegens]